MLTDPDSATWQATEEAIILGSHEADLRGALELGATDLCQVEWTVVPISAGRPK